MVISNVMYVLMKTGLSDGLIRPKKTLVFPIFSLFLPKNRPKHVLKYIYCFELLFRLNFTLQQIFRFLIVGIREIVLRT